MTLTTHALVGAAAAQLFPQNPYLAFAAGFASHFVIDALPHWDYTPPSIEKDEQNPLNTDMRIDRQFVFDLFRIGGDALFGVLLSIALFSFSLFHTPLTIVLIGAIAGILPDPLQFVYFKTRSKLLEPLQRFHIWIQEGKSLYISPVYGIGLQAVLVLCIIAVQKILLFV